ncbi:MAG: class I SAM-dependent methyltransferase [Candidatus Lokiarchaeota archaeon]|nr:class I SAM-dependent methyltransferase [Candidatus Lokiarchaeota archaeon]
MDKHGKLFNRIAIFYQFTFPNQIRNYRNLLSNHVIRKLLPESGRVLDLGTGTGAFGYVFQELGYEVTGVDVAPKMVKICRKNHLKCKLCDIPNGLPFNDDFFDFVISANFIHGLAYENRIHVYQESKRVSKKFTLFYDYNLLQKHRWKTKFIEWLEGGAYRDFCNKGLNELNNYFKNVNVYELNNKNAFYLCF